MAGIAVDIERLRLARLRKGWSTTQLSSRCEELGTKVDRSNVWKYERGKARPGAGTLLALATALDLDVTDLALPLDAA